MKLLIIYRLQKAFKIQIFASDIDSPRQMTQGDDGRLYVGVKTIWKDFCFARY